MIYVLTRSHNDYDQYGDYLVSAWYAKPSGSDLRRLLPESSEQDIQHILSGGGRRESESVWHFLRAISPGQDYGAATEHLT
jgi:hypothetical protein